MRVNNARLHSLELEPRDGSLDDGFSVRKAAYEHNGPERSNLRYGDVFAAGAPAHEAFA